MDPAKIVIIIVVHVWDLQITVNCVLILPEVLLQNVPVQMGFTKIQKMENVLNANLTVLVKHMKFA
jgi:hypothetical protein